MSVNRKGFWNGWGLTWVFQNPCWPGFDPCRVIRSVGQDLGPCRCRRWRAGAARGWPRSSGAGQAARGDAGGAHRVNGAALGGGAAAPPRSGPRQPQPRPCRRILRAHGSRPACLPGQDGRCIFLPHPPGASSERCRGGRE